ncbi:hypothetical protein JT358_16980 [Micrococcales bacterium 31B]|nr:hypothetical protein [Micrococcales bacterium 31B]
MTSGPPARPAPTSGGRTAAAEHALEAALSEVHSLSDRDVHDHVGVFERAQEALKARLEAETA